MSAISFTGCIPSVRLAGIADPGTFEPMPGAQPVSVLAGIGRLADRQVTLVATQREIAGGSLGVGDSQLIGNLIEASRSAGRPIVFCLDSAGAKLSEGLPALGAFRQLYRHLLDYRLAGLPALALIGRDCFGGASMLAATCARRIYSSGSRLAMSGPAVIQALGGRDELEASDAAAVIGLMGGAARVRQQSADILCEDSLEAYGAAARTWITGACVQVPNLLARHNELGMRLLAHGLAPSPPENPEADLPSILREIVPEGFQAHEMDGVLVGHAVKTSPNAFYGFIAGRPVGVLALWTMAGECLALAMSKKGEAITVFLDSPGQATTAKDEQLILSDYVAHLAMVLSHLRELGHRLTLQVVGDAAGGIYVALAAPASRVVALPGANVQVLPPAAMARILGRADKSGDVDDYLRAGVIDTLI